MSSCADQDWACLVKLGQVQRAPEYVKTSAQAFLKINSANTAEVSIVTMIVHPAQPVLYVNFTRQECDDIGWCFSRSSDLLQYSHDGWQIVDDAVPYPNETICPPVYAFLLYGVGRDGALYYGRMNTQRSTCAHYEDRQIMRYKEGLKTIVQNHTVWQGDDTPSYMMQWRPESTK